MTVSLLAVQRFRPTSRELAVSPWRKANPPERLVTAHSIRLLVRVSVPWRTLQSGPAGNVGRPAYTGQSNQGFYARALQLDREAKQAPNTLRWTEGTSLRLARQS